jgi:hypothetical protein
MPAARARIGRLTAGLRQLPDFLVIGAKRAGTTSLYRYLVDHPDIRAARLFKGSHYFDVRYGRPWWWYRSCFPLRRPPAALTGEASPYYMFHPLAPGRIATSLPGVRMIALLRDPVDRAYSQWLFERRSGHETLDFEAAVAAEPSRLEGEVERMRAEPGYESFALRHHGYLARSRYGEQLFRLYTLVDPARVLVLQSERLSHDPAHELAGAWDFLGLPPHEPAPLRLDAAPPSASLASDVRARVAALLEPDVERLVQLPRVDVSWPGYPAVEDARR